MLHPGLYEQVINNALTGELAEIPEARKSVAPIDKAEASKVLAQYLADVVQKGLDNVLDNGGDISAQIGLTNQIVNLIQNTTKEADFAALGVDRRAEQLLALLRETDPRLAVGKTAADIERPETSIAQSSLFTGAVHEPQMFTELKKEIVSADRIDMLVSFIKWIKIYYYGRAAGVYAQRRRAPHHHHLLHGRYRCESHRGTAKAAQYAHQGQLQHQDDPAPRQGIYLLPRNRLHDGLCGLVQSVQCGTDQRP